MSVEWLLIRGSGLVAFGMLALATIWGLLMSTKLLGRAVKPKGVNWFHESLGIGALLATIIHMVALSIHDYIDFTWTEILVPGRSDWRPVAVALGVVGFYALTLVSLTFYVKSFIGQQAWRTIHNLSFGLFLTTLLHSLFAGTDTSNPVVISLYAATGAAVLILVVIRVLQSRQEAVASPRPRPRPEPQSQQT